MRGVKGPNDSPTGRWYNFTTGNWNPSLHVRSDQYASRTSPRKLEQNARYGYWTSRIYTCLALVPTPCGSAIPSGRPSRRWPIPSTRHEVRPGLIDPSCRGRRKGRIQPRGEREHHWSCRDPKTSENDRVERARPDIVKLITGLKGSTTFRSCFITGANCEDSPGRAIFTKAVQRRLIR